MSEFATGRDESFTVTGSVQCYRASLLSGAYVGCLLWPIKTNNINTYFSAPHTAGDARTTVGYAQYFGYHLNDMHAQCIHQEARGETWTTHPSAVCPDCGYKLGSAWLKRELPAVVIRWAESLQTEVTV